MKHLRTGLMGAALLLPASALALPTDKGIAMIPAASKVAEEIHFFHNWILMPIITGISLFVLALLLWIIVRFNAKANPKAQQFSHNTMLEVVWTGLPILILVFIALFSFDLLYKEDVIPDGKRIVAEGDGATTAFTVVNDFPNSRKLARPEHVQVFVGDLRLKRGAGYTLTGLGKSDVTVTLTSAPARGERVVIDAGRSLVGLSGLFGGGDQREIALAPSMTLKAIGNQWNWTYAYPDFGDFDFTANMLTEDKTTKELYRFEVDNRVVVPVGETIRVTTTGSDVIHSWALPNFGIKIDAVPGRINETWFKADREGVYYGQCSEICGVRHSAMPIAVEVVSREAFCGWVAGKQQEFAIARTDEQLRAEPICGALRPATIAAAEPAPANEAAPAPVEVAAASGEPSPEAVAAEIKRCQADIDTLFAGKTIEFASGAATIVSASEPLLESLASAASSCEGVAIKIAGHTDSSGNAAKNTALSLARAEAVKTWLVGKGVAADRLSAEGLGSAKPVADNATPAGRAQNRRIEFTVAAASTAKVN